MRRKQTAVKIQSDISSFSVGTDTVLKPTDTFVYALGGLNEVGKNMYCIEHEDTIVIIDCGVRFPEESLLGVDYVIPDFTHLIRNEDKIQALIITHGHEDHIGGIPFLLQSVRIPRIYAPRFAASLIEKKLEERRVGKETEIEIIDENSRVECGKIIIGFFNVFHSIPDSLGVFINTPNGRIVETGDFKFDLTPVGTNTDYQKLAYMGQIGVTLLMSDSTNSEIDDFSVSEKVVAKSILDIIRKARGRMIISTFSSNVHRVQQILEAAVSCERKVVVSGRSMENVIEIARNLKTINVPDETFIPVELINTVPANRLLILCTGSQGEPLAALSRIANGTHKDIRIMPGDTVVFSSSAIPGNSTSISKVVNSLTRAGANVLTNTPLTSLHTTGHASSEEQKLMLQLTKPKYFMPMHGEYRMLRIHGETATQTGVDPENVFICANGDVVVLRDSEAFRSSVRVQTDAIYVDGNDASGLSTAVLKDRKVLADNGLVAVIVAIDSRSNKIICRPSIVSRGFVVIKDFQPLLKEAELLVYEALRKKMMEKTTFGELKNTIKNCLEPFLFQKTHRSPIVIPVILNHKDAMAQMTNRNQ